MSDFPHLMPLSYREGINLPGRNPGIKNIIQGINHPALAHFIMVE